MNDVLYEGWVRSDLGYDTVALKKMGLHGFKLSKDGRCFEHCVGTEGVLKFMYRAGFYVACFTAIGKDGNQLPKMRQKYWFTTGGDPATVKKRFLYHMVDSFLNWILHIPETVLK